MERMHVGDETFWSIGDVARKTGLTVKLIRHWSDTGVIHPACRTPAGYRMYGTEALARLQLAQTLRGLGLGLAAIRDALEREDTLSEVAATHIDALEAQIRTLRSQQAVLRSVTRRDTTAEGLTIMTELARMSAAERRTIIHDFVTETLGELDVPTYRRGLLAATPDLPADRPTNRSTPGSNWANSSAAQVCARACVAWPATRPNTIRASTGTARRGRRNR